MIALVLSALAADPIPAVAPDVTLEEVRRHDWAGGARVRVAQHVRGLPVEGWDLTMATDPRGEPIRVTGRPVGRAPTEWIATLSADDAVSAALPAVRYRGRGALWTPRAHEVAWLDGDTPVRAWAVDASTASPPATWRVVVHARTGAVLAVLPTSHDVDGNIYDPSPALAEVEQAELPNLVGPDALSGLYADIYSCDEWRIDDTLFGVSSCDAESRHAAPDANGDYLFTPEPASGDDPFGEVQLYYHLNRVSAWVEDRYGFFHDEPVVGRLNFPMTNAFFGDFDGDGRGDVSFGTSPDGHDFAYDADVVYHEFGHSLVDGLGNPGFLNADAIGLDWVGGGLNEGSADVLAMLLTLDPLMAEYAGQALRDGPIRDLTSPQRCPHDLEGEVHDDGEIWASMFWQLIDDPLVGPDVSAELLYAAMTTFTLDTTWNSAGTAVLDAAADLLGAGQITATTHDAIVGHVDVANLVDCDRIVPLDGGVSTSSRLLALGLAGDFELVPLEKQMRIDVPEDAIGLVVSISDYRTSNDQIGWKLFVRRGEPVEHEVVDLAIVGVRSAKPSVYDLAIDGRENQDVTITAEELPGGPGGTFYLAISSRDLGGMQPFDISYAALTVSATPLFDERGGGCACDTQRTPGLAWLALVALVARRRR